MIDYRVASIRRPNGIVDLVAVVIQKWLAIRSQFDRRERLGQVNLAIPMGRHKPGNMEIGRILNVTESTVRNHLLQARRVLRLGLEREYPGLVPESYRRDGGES